ncbi:MAG: FHA domain-containing protein [Candidatus Pacebacteria bacterium]|nr:FHA domain-containing protein [Candidatus Paceibacterota bacterium]
MVSGKEIQTAPRLRLTVLESPTYKAKTEFLINACGYIYSLRKARDGCVYIGTKTTNNETGEPLNDIAFQTGEPGMGNRHLLIKYDLERKGYYMKDMGEGTGTFIRIEKSLALQYGYIISYGNSHMYVILQPDKSMQLRFLDGPRTDESL